MQTGVAFLNARVKQLDQDDWKKLVRVLECVKGTLNLTLTLSAGKNGINVLDWHVNGAHQVHADLRGHTGAIMTLGKGGIYNASVKQKMNTRSSAETELIASWTLTPRLLSSASGVPVLRQLRV